MHTDFASTFRAPAEVRLYSSTYRLIIGLG